MAPAFLHRALAADALLLSLAVQLQGPAVPQALLLSNSDRPVWPTCWRFCGFEKLHQPIQLHILAERRPLWEVCSAFRAGEALLSCRGLFLSVPVAVDALLTVAVPTGQRDRDGKHLQTNAAA